MKKIGFLNGMEDSFPITLLENINQRRAPGIKAEFIQLDAIKMVDMLGYNVILDRVSYEVPYYNSILKMASLEGVRVINNPFWSSADDNFFHNVIASKMKIKVPRTVILPSKEHPPGTTAETLRNLVYPINWDEVFEYVGFPAYIKPNIENTSHIFFKVYNPAEFFSAYDLTGNNVMLLQESIEYEEFYRCYVIGKKYVRTMNYDPAKPRHLRFISKPKTINENLKAILEEMSLKICIALGFDFNVCEFAIRDGIPYAVEFINTAPTADRTFLHDECFNWLIEHTSDFLIEQAKKRKSRPGNYNWGKLLSGEKR
ncbi:RimK family alpha-L-glutamate ligase [Bacteroidota bacterium]